MKDAQDGRQLKVPGAASRTRAHGQQRLDALTHAERRKGATQMRGHLAGLESRSAALDARVESVTRTADAQDRGGYKGGD